MLLSRTLQHAPLNVFHFRRLRAGFSHLKVHFALPLDQVSYWFCCLLPWEPSHQHKGRGGWRTWWSWILLGLICQWHKVTQGIYHQKCKLKLQEVLGYNKQCSSSKNPEKYQQHFWNSFSLNILYTGPNPKPTEFNGKTPIDFIGLWIEPT